MPPRREGAPAFGAVSPANKWSVGVGAELTIDVVLKNVGGAATGVWLEIGGPASESVELRGVSLDGQPAVVEGSRAALATAKVSAAFEVTKKRGEPVPPDESRKLRVVVRGTRPGSALFTIRIGPGAGQTTSGSALVGRMLEITP